MRPLVTIVALCALIWHLVVGCCAHHGHTAYFLLQPSPAKAGAARATTCLTTAALRHSHCASHGPHSHAHDLRPEKSTAPGKHCPASNDCHQSHCSLLPLPKVEGAAPLTTGGFETLPIASAGAISFAHALRSTMALRRRSAGFLGAPLRAHLRLSVLLN